MTTSLTQKVFFNTSAQLAGRVLTTIIGLVTFGLLTRYLGVEGYGNYTTVFAYNSLLIIVADFGFNWVALREISRLQGQQKVDVFQNVLSLRLIFAVVVALVMLGVLSSLNYPSEVRLGIVLVSLSLLWLSQTYTINSYLQSEFVMYKSVISDLISRIFTLGGIIWALLNGYGLITVFVIIILGFFIYYLIDLLWIGRTKVYGFQFDRPIVTRIWRESFWMGIVIVLAFTYFKIDTVILSLMKSPVDVGIYGAPFKVVEILLAVPAMFLGNVFPALSQSGKNNLERLTQLVGKSFEGLTAMALPMTLGGIILARPIIELAAGTEYLKTSTVTIGNLPIDASVVLQILMVAIMFSFWVQIFYLAMIALSKQKSLIATYVGAAIFNVVANVLFIPEYSYLAAAVISVLSEAIVMVWTYRLLRRSLDWRIDWLKFGKIIIATFIMGGVIYILKDLNLLLVTILGVIVYSVMIFKVFQIFKVQEFLRR